VKVTILDFSNPTRIYAKPTGDVVLPVATQEHALRERRFGLR
jgi:hypothetical protein